MRGRLLMLFIRKLFFIGKSREVLSSENSLASLFSNALVAEMILTIAQPASHVEETVVAIVQ